MVATAGNRLTLDPMGKMFQNPSSLKPLGQLKPNCPGMIIGRSSTKFLFSMPIGNPRSLQQGLSAEIYTLAVYDNVQIWQASLGGDYNWKNHPTHENGKYSMLIDINGDGLPDQSLDFCQILDQVSHRHLCQST